MEAPRVIRLARDDDSSSALVRVTHRGPQPLDLLLEASEGDAPYSATLTHAAALAARPDNSPASPLEWEAVLRALFSHQPLPDIHATASVQPGKRISITVRKQIQGITQRLGSLSLEHAPALELDIFQWCVASQTALEATGEALAASAARVAELELAVRDLASQLDDLISTKQDDETLLLQNFGRLLNEKKVKIRQQQSIIAQHQHQHQDQHQQQHQDQAVAAAAARPRRGMAQASPSPHPPPARRATRSRPAKRKTAPGERESSGGGGEVKSEPEDSPAGLALGLDTGTGLVAGETDATASPDDGDDEQDDPNPRQLPYTDTNDDDDDDGDDHRMRDDESIEKGPASGRGDPVRKMAVSGSAAEAPPPPRTLPFAKKNSKNNNKTPAPRSAPPPASGGSETEDDEL